MAEPPYGIIWKALMKGRVIPFLGAGASFVGRSANAKWDSASPSFLPSAAELANYLAKDACFPSADPHELGDLAKVATYYEDLSGRPSLRESLHQVLRRDFAPGAIHALLAEIPVPLLIVSTNYDSLIEEAFRKAQRPFDLVVYPADHKDIANAVLWWRAGEPSPDPVSPNTLVGLDDRTVIYKMHGTMSQRGPPKEDDFVVTEEDYIEFLSRMTINTALPAFFFERCEEASFLFLGYSLKDWNVRVILNNLSKHFSGPVRAGQAGAAAASPSSEPRERPAHWAIQLAPSEVEQSFWVRRGVNIFDQSVDDFAAKMRACRPKE